MADAHTDISTPTRRFEPRDPPVGRNVPVVEFDDVTKVYDKGSVALDRASMRRAFVNHPPVVLCDEPNGNLDTETSIGIMQLIYRINKTGTTVVVATHDREMVDKMRRRVVELSEGRIVRDEVSGLYR